MFFHSSSATENANRELVAAQRAAELAEFRAARATLLQGSHDVGCDEYTSGFFGISERPVAELSYSGHAYDSARSLHRLPNGDWLEIIGNSQSWTRHTYDKAYALDRARRAAIGGYTIRADMAALIDEIVDVGANRLGIYAMWQESPHTTQRAYSAEGNLFAAEQQAYWAKCLTEDGLARHPERTPLLRRAIALLAEPDVLREFPADVSPAHHAILRDLEAAVAAIEA